MAEECAELIRTGLADITTRLQELKQEMRNEWSAFKDEMKKEMKEEMASFRQEMDQRMIKCNEAVDEQKVALEGTQLRVAELEEWKTGANEGLLLLAEQMDHLQSRQIMLEAYGRRNNIRIFNLDEDLELEGSSVADYVEKLFRSELQLPEETQLQIQRAHRALAEKPTSPSAPPRSIVVNFLRFEIKEMILKKAWERKIQVGGKQLGFDHDYPPEVVQKRKEYIPVKKILKEKGIKFQTPFTKMRVSWPDGVKMYHNAAEVIQAMEERGYIEDTSAGRRRDGEGENGGEAASGGGRTSNRPEEMWRRVGLNRGAAKRAREKLQAYKKK